MTRAEYQLAYYHKTKEVRFPLLAAASKRYRDKNPEKVKAWQKEYSRKNRETLREKARVRHERHAAFIAEAKNKPCADCWGWYEPYQMHFDHRDPTTKKFNVGEHRYGILGALKEAAKCDVVCANCHAVRTHNQIKSGMFSHMVKQNMNRKAA